jgi:hypothetical protein
MTLTLVEMVGSTWTIGVEIENTTADTPGTPNANRITTLGFATTPNITGGTISNIVPVGSYSWGYTTGGEFPGFGGGPNSLVEFCVSDGGNCAQAGGDGLLAGDSSSFTFGLTAANTTSPLSFDFFGVRFQSVAENGGFGGSTSFEGSAIPLPAAGWMLLAGIGGLAAMRRRKKAA